jgi:8-oxo-dGTP pyrophosphatase MutT (NUDIX family)
VPLPPPYDLPSLAARLARVARPSAPAELIRIDNDPSPPSAPLKRAAVAAILRDPGLGADAELLLIRRTEREGDPWSGHIAFPGGRSDDRDPSLFATAVRETREEVGLDLEAHGTLLAEMTEIAAVARSKRIGMTITPFVFRLDREVPFTLDPREVAETLWVPFGPLARRDQPGTLEYMIEGYPVELPCLYVGEQRHVLWGLTHRMLEMMLEAMSQVT